MEKEVRIDKYLWSVRIFKTRSKATQACKGRKVLLNDKYVKPSSVVRIEDKIEVKRPPIIRSFVVISILENRVSAKLVSDYLRETTPESEFEKIKKTRDTGIVRHKGKGRPTKKERRQLDKINPFK